MRDHDGGAAAHEVLERALHKRLRLGVKRGGRLVEHQDRGIDQDGASNGHALALATRELDAPLAHHGVEAVRQPLYELERVCLLGGTANLLLRGTGLSVGDVLANGAVEEQGLLGNVGDLAAEALLGAVAHVLPVHKHTPLLDVIQAQQQLGERGLARTGAAHQTNALTSWDVEVEVLEDVVILRRVRVAEAQALEVDATVSDLKRLCVRVVRHERRLVQHARHLGGIAKGPVDALHHGVEVVEAHREVVRVGEHHDERTGAYPKPRITAHHEDRDHEHDDGDECRSGEASPHGGAHVGILGCHGLAVGRGEEPTLVVLATIGLDGEDVGYRIGKHARKLVLRTRGLCRKRKNAPVHAIGNEHVEHEHRNEDDHEEWCNGSENAHREHDGSKRWPQRVRHHIYEAGVARDKARGLAHQAATKAAVVECH